MKEINELKNKYKVIKEELIETTKNYIGKKTYKFTLKDGTVKICDQITKRDRNGDAVIIVPILEDNSVCMIIEERPLTKEEVILEFPAGMVDEGELPVDAALRELKEETGLIPETIEEIEWHYQDQGCSKAIIRTYLATNCKFYEKELEETEKIENVILTKEKLKKELKEGTNIVDSGTKLAAYTYLFKN